MPRQTGSARWLAEQLQARGIPVSHTSLHQHPERIEYDADGNPIGYTPGEPSRPGGAVGRRWVRLPRWEAESDDNQD